MPRTTQLWSQLPWQGGMNTSLDPAMVPENMLVNSENVTVDVNDSKKKRDPVNKNWDDVTSGSNVIIGGGDFWYYSGGSMLQKKVSIDNGGLFKSYNASSGANTALTVAGVALSSPTVASCRVMNSLFCAAMDGSGNRIKKWDASSSVTDLLAKWAHTVLTCSSSGTTRTMKLGQTFKGIVGDYIVISGMSASFNGTWAVASISTVTLTNDTITFAGTGSITLANGIATYDHTTSTWTKTGHGMVAGQSLTLTTSNTLPASYALSTQYFVISSGLTANAFKLSASSGGSAVAAGADDGTGDHTINLSGSGAVVQGIAPNGSILSTHQGRMLTNDKTRPYRVHYSQVGDNEIWWGYGDSGAIDIDVGDDDPVGVTAIFPTFQGDLYVAKQTKLYRIRGVIPDYTIEKITDGIGAISHEAVAAVDQSDVIWASEKGIHSLQATQKFGDVEEAFLSKDIQKSFNGSGDYAWDTSRLKYVKAKYVPQKNLVYFGVKESGLSGSYNNCLWIYHTIQQAWISRWPNISCETLFTAKDSDTRRVYLGSSTGRIYKTSGSGLVDTTETGASSSITLKLKTGYIYVTKNPYMNIAFKRLALYHTPRGTQTITATAQVDKGTAQSVTFQTTAAGDLLGSTFILGSSVLTAGTGLFAPYTRLIDGYGRGLQVEIQEASATADYTIEGLGIEFEPAEIQHQVNQGAA